MSREMKWKKEMREVTVCEEGELTCDACEKVIDITKQNGTFYSVCSGHHEWGNDSVDSVECLDACCDECLITLVNKWLKKWEGYNTAYINIERECISDLRRAKNE